MFAIYFAASMACLLAFLIINLAVMLALLPAVFTLAGLAVLALGWAIAGVAERSELNSMLNRH